MSSGFALAEQLCGMATMLTERPSVWQLTLPVRDTTQRPSRRRMFIGFHALSTSR